ncbi:hypothetical protein OIU76_005933 [Salix suchowensis]|nr:hypothetical protein OIU76_005933 [Salix suchowensis]
MEMLTHHRRADSKAYSSSQLLLVRHLTRSSSSSKINK